MTRCGDESVFPDDKTGPVPFAAAISPGNPNFNQRLSNTFRKFDNRKFLRRLFLRRFFLRGGLLTVAVAAEHQHNDQTQICERRTVQGTTPKQEEKSWQGSSLTIPGSFDQSSMPLDSQSDLRQLFCENSLPLYSFESFADCS